MKHEACDLQSDGRISDVAKLRHACDLLLGDTLPLVAHILIIGL